MKEGVFQKIKIFVSGLLVGTADLIPGISGGTVAFIINIYEELLKSIGTLNKNSFYLLLQGRFSDFIKSVSWKFLVLFLAGQITAFVLFAKGFNFMLNNEPYRTFLYATMMGLVLGSVSFCFKKVERFGKNGFLFFVIGIASAFWISQGNFNSKETFYDVPVKEVSNVQNVKGGVVKDVSKSDLIGMISKKRINNDCIVERTSDGKLLYVNEIEMKTFDLYIVVAGILAASAMLLPGISGSYLLTVLGMYGMVLGAVVEFLEALKVASFDMHSFRIIASIGIGIAIGAVSFSHVINFLLKRYRNNTLCCLIGFMIGSLKAVYPFVNSSYIYSPLHDKICLKQGIAYIPSAYELLFGMLFFGVGFLMVITIESYANRKVTA